MYLGLLGKKVNTSLTSIHDHFTPWSQYLGYTKEKKLELLRANKQTFFLFEKDDVLLFWDEFQHRFNFIAVDYLVYTHEILGTIYESWPIYKIIFTTVAIDIIIILIYRKSIFSPKKQS